MKHRFFRVLVLAARGYMQLLATFPDRLDSIPRRPLLVWVN